jgi:DNA-binding CsgD family transcriptional regulator
MADFGGRLFRMRVKGFHLSVREEKILQLLFVGTSSNEIARDLDINPATVKADMRQILRKVKARSKTLPSIDAQPLATH